jgi:NADH:ubiquinone oxidoreductase subunit 4 (subunit M)
MLHMTARVIWGPLKTPAVGAHGHSQEDQGQAATPEHGGHARHETHPGDIGLREISVLVPIAIAVVILGVKPGIVIDRMLEPVQEIRSPLQRGENLAHAAHEPKQLLADVSRP